MFPLTWIAVSPLISLQLVAAKSEMFHHRFTTSSNFGTPRMSSIFFNRTTDHSEMKLQPLPPASENPTHQRTAHQWETTVTGLTLVTATSWINWWQVRKTPKTHPLMALKIQANASAKLVGIGSAFSTGSSMTTRTGGESSRSFACSSSLGRFVHWEP